MRVVLPIVRSGVTIDDFPRLAGVERQFAADVSSNQ
jgi:hypothetical protein